MRYFRQRHIPSAPLLYEDNHVLLEGKREKLAYTEEVLDNLAASVGLARPEGCGCAGCMGCASIYLMVLTIVFTALGVLMMVVGIGWLWQSRHLEPDTVVPALFLVIGIILLSPRGGLQYIFLSHVEEQGRVYLTSLYNQLLAHGQILEGTIISVEPVLVEKVVTSQLILHYRFTAPGQYGDCEGQYKLSTKDTFAPGQKVTVLYLSRFIQILL